MEAHLFKDISLEEEDFWKSFYTLPESSEDIFNLFSPKDIRKVRDEYPGNFKSLFKVISRQLFNISEAMNVITEVELKEILNCVRLLTRLLPYVYEEPKSNIHSFLWDIQQEDDGPWGERLAITVAKLLFMDGLCVSTDVTEGELIQLLVWSPGIGVTFAPDSPTSIINNRVEILRLMLTLLSEPMYDAPKAAASHCSRFSQVLVEKLDKKLFMTLLCSLLNTFAQYDPIGWGLIPYNHIIFSDSMELLCVLCLQTLVALLDVSTSRTPSPSATDLVDEPEEGSTSTHDKERPGNQFKSLLSKLHRSADFKVILTGISRLLTNPLYAANVYLPGSRKQVNMQTEVLMILWKLFECNEQFIEYMSQQPSILEIVGAMIYYIFENRNDSVHLGSIRCCIFLLHKLSENRSFAVQLNSPFDVSKVGPVMKYLTAFSAGHWSDFVFMSIYSIITTTQKTMIASTHEHLLIAMVNLSPYIKSLTAVTSNKFQSLFNAVSSPGYMFYSEFNHRHVFYLLEMFNYLIQYQMMGQSKLIYTILRNKEKFYQLEKLTFESGMADIEKFRERKERTQGEGPKMENSDPKLDKGKETAKFEATKEWFDVWKPQLPLLPILQMSDALSPQVEQLCAEKEVVDDTLVIQFLESSTLVGIIPPPHPITIRKFWSSDHPSIRNWFTSFLWGSIFVKSHSIVNSDIAKLNPAIWTGTKISLFQIKITTE